MKIDEVIIKRVLNTKKKKEDKITILNFIISRDHEYFNFNKCLRIFTVFNDRNVEK